MTTVSTSIDSILINSYCKAHPDEKGIETVISNVFHQKTQEDCKAHPDEKGIETVISNVFHQKTQEAVSEGIFSSKFSVSVRRRAGRGLQVP